MKYAPTGVRVQKAYSSYVLSLASIISRLKVG